jgi:hypothetical protein
VLTEFDQNTIANMTAALEYVCKKIPIDKDNHETRKRIANAMIDRARSGNLTFVEFQSVGLEALDQITRPARFNFFGLRWLASVPWRVSR